MVVNVVFGVLMIVDVVLCVSVSVVMMCVCVMWVYVVDVMMCGVEGWLRDEVLLSDWDGGGVCVVVVIGDGGDGCVVDV